MTVRELLTHTGGVDNPAESFAEAVPDLLALYGPLLPCSGTRGAFRHSDGGYAALGQLAADLTGVPYAEAAARLVLRPLGMSGSAFPAGWPGTDAVTGYGVTPRAGLRQHQLASAPCRPRGGLWATADDLIRFGCRWSSLLPRALAREALTPQHRRAFRWRGHGSGLDRQRVHRDNRARRGWPRRIGIPDHPDGHEPGSHRPGQPADTDRARQRPYAARGPDRALPAIGPADRGAGRRVLPGRP